MAAVRELLDDLDVAARPASGAPANETVADPAKTPVPKQASDQVQDDCCGDLSTRVDNLDAQLDVILSRLRTALTDDNTPSILPSMSIRRFREELVQAVQGKVIVRNLTDHAVRVKVNSEYLEIDKQKVARTMAPIGRVWTQVLSYNDQGLDKAWYDVSRQSKGTYHEVSEWIFPHQSISKKARNYFQDPRAGEPNEAVLLILVRSDR